MSAKEGIPVSTRPIEAIEASSSLDVEMTGPLTSTEERSNRSRSSSPLTEKMSSYNSNRDHTERHGSYPAQPGFNNGTPARTNGWRDDAPGSGSQYQYQSQYDPATPIMVGHYLPPRPRGSSLVVGEHSVPLSTVIPGAAWPSDAQLTASYGYGIRREDGSITRLYPADTIPPPHNLPTRQGPEGLIILPAPRQQSPARRMGAEVMIPGEVIQQLTQGTLHPDYPNSQYDATQMHIDSIVAHSAYGSLPSSVSPPQRRREKIYCDKWIHEGVCAFTQMGCKYKHEMPTDKATQMTLGLNHGLPNWYRRAFGINLHNEPASAPTVGSPPQHARLEGSWRNRNHSQLESSGPGRQSGAPNNRRSYGPIAPPAGSQPSGSSTNYSGLKIEDNLQDQEDEGEEDDDTVTWRGRQR